jgi:hypothetical protein
MDTRTHLNDDDLTLLYYGELAGADEDAARTHLQSCPACRDRQGELLRLFALIDTSPVPEPAEAFEATLWQRLQPGVRAARPAGASTRGAWLHGWLSWGTPMRWALAGGMAAALVLAFAAGRIWEGGPRGAVAPPAVAGVPDAAALRERVLLSALRDHFDRSERVIVDLASAAPGAGIDLTGEQRRAADLLAATRIYRRAALEAGDAKVAEVLEALERVLVEVTVAPATPTTFELEALQARIDRQELLFKLRVSALAIRDREEDRTRAPLTAGGTGA